MSTNHFAETHANAYERYQKVQRLSELERMIRESAHRQHAVPIEWQAEYDELLDGLGFTPYQPKDIDKMVPIGVMPKKMWVANRVVELTEAILRYNAAGVPVPSQWLDELSEHLVQEEG